MIAASLGAHLAWTPVAQAGDRAADVMPLGQETAAPPGFLEMCERAPTECVADLSPTATASAEVRGWARRARWAAVFQNAGIAVPAATAPAPVNQVVARPVKTRDAVRRDKDARRKRAEAPVRKTPKRAAPPPAAPAVAPPAPHVAATSIETLEAVNRSVNRAIRRRTDADAYGRADVWQRPQGPRASGDCEDYVLAKRHALIAAGVDPAALSIAVVRTRRGEGHAVLLVATPQGELVLDNLDPWVRPWREVGYQWLERQAPGRPLTWVQPAL